MQVQEVIHGVHSMIAVCSWGGFRCGLGVPELQFEKLATLLTDSLFVLLLLFFKVQSSGYN